MQTSIIAPIVAIIALFLKEAFGINLGDGEIQIIVDGIVALGLAIVAIVGVFKSYKKQDKK